MVHEIKKQGMLGLSAVMLAAVLSVTGCGKATPVDTLESDTQEGTISTEAGSAQPDTTEPVSEESSAEVVITMPEETTEPETYPIAEGYTRLNQIVEPTVNVNLRSGPGTEYESYGLLIAQTRVERISDGGEWSQVVYEGRVCYVASQYLTVVEGDVVITQPAAEETSSAEESTGATGETDETVVSTGGNPATYESLSMDELAGLSNESVPYGFSSGNRDALNRPTGVFYYENLYGQYAADFIGPETNTIYLTMDEGYEAGFTPEILDTLKEKNVSAVFFVTKQFVTEHPELVQRMIAEGHQIGNHTCAHPSAGMPSMGLQAEYDDILWLHNYVLENFGYEMTLFRFPTGTFSEQSLALTQSMGYCSVFWSFAHRDWILDDQPEEAAALQSCLDSLHPGAIYLLHAVSATNTHNMAAFIDGARTAGYEFGVYPAHGF